MASLPGSPTPALDGIIRPTRSQGSTPILGLEEIILLKWKSGPSTPVSVPNSTAMTLLAGFAQGNIQMQGNAIKHLQEGNLARLQQVTTELLEPGTGRVMGSISDVNFVEGMKQMPDEESIGEMLNELVPENSKSSDSNNEIDSDHGCYSMVKEKQGKPSVASSSATKAADKKKEKKVPSKGDSAQKYAGGSGYSAAFAAGAFQHGPGYYTTDAQGCTDDKYRRGVFQDDEEQTVEESSNEDEEGNGDGEQQQQERDSDNVPLAELLRQEGEPAGARPTKGETEAEDEEVSKEELEELDKVHRAEMERREAENQT